MYKKALTFFLIFSLLLSLCGCFPTLENNYSTEKTNNSDKITFEDLSSLQKHINEEPFENFSVNADVIISVKNNFNTYKASSADYDFDLCTKLFLKNKKITDTRAEDGYRGAYCEDGSSMLKYGGIINQYSYVYYVKEYVDRELESFYYDGGNNRNGLINYERDAIFAKKELDFMSSDDACSLVDEKLKGLCIDVDSYLIYSVDYDYIKKEDDKYREIYGKYTDDFIDYTKDDEFYIIVPRIGLPNGSLLTEMNYVLAEDNFTTIDSAIVYAIVGKNGILKLECSGIFDISDENTTVKDIVSINNALETIKSEYKNVYLQDKLTVNQIELSYVPYVVDRKNNTYELKATWVFSIIRTFSDGYSEHFVKLIDAVTGKQIMFGNQQL